MFAGALTPPPRPRECVSNSSCENYRIRLRHYCNMFKIKRFIAIHTIKHQSAVLYHTLLTA